MNKKLSFKVFLASAITLSLSITASAIVEHINSDNEKQLAENKQIQESRDKIYATRPKGLHGLVWGDDLSQLKNAKLITNNNENIKFENNFLDNDYLVVEQCYIKPNEQLSLGQEHLTQIQYCFVNKKFQSFKLFYKAAHKEVHEGKMDYYISDEDMMNSRKVLDDISLAYNVPINGFDKSFSWDERIKAYDYASENNKIKLQVKDSFGSENSYVEVKNDGYYVPYTQKIHDEYLKENKATIKNSLD